MTGEHNWVTDTCQGCVDRQEEIKRLEADNAKLREGAWKAVKSIGGAASSSLRLRKILRDLEREDDG